MVHYHHGDQHDGDLVDLDQHDGHHEEEERGVPLPIPRKPAAAHFVFSEKRLSRNLFCPVLHPLPFLETVPARAKQS